MATLLSEQQLQLTSTDGLDPALKNDEKLSECGDYMAALHNLRSYVDSHAESADAHHLLGYVLYRQDKPSELLARYTIGARFRKPGANDLAAIAMDYVVLHNYSDADNWLTLAVTWPPENALYWYYLGRTKYNEKRRTLRYHSHIYRVNTRSSLFPRVCREIFRKNINGQER